MKKAVIILILILGLFSFTNLASAQAHFCQHGDPNLHGVFIDGQCFNCGSDDGVCPEDYGADCSVVPDVDCGPQAPKAFWSLDNLTSEDKVTVFLPDGRDIYMVVRNLDSSDFPDNTEVTFDIYEDKLLDKKIADTTAYISGGKAIGIWKINETVIDEINIDNLIYFDAAGLRSEPKLNITTTYSSGIAVCGDYDNEGDCNSNSYSVGYSIGAWETYDTACKRRINKTGCSWIIGSGCAQNTTVEYDTSAIDCIEVHPEISSCLYTEGERIGDCSVAGNDFFQINYTSTQPGCVDFTSGIIPCPTQVKLGFFGFFNIISSLMIISLIYFLFRKKESL